MASTHMQDWVACFVADRDCLYRFYSVELSPNRRQRLRQHLAEWSEKLAAVDFYSLSKEGKVDWILFQNHLKGENQALNREEQRANETLSLLPFAEKAVAMIEARQRVDPMNPRLAAEDLADIAKTAKEAPDGESPRPVLYRASKAAVALADALKEWYEFYAGYDPLFTWWAAEAYKAADEAIREYAKRLWSEDEDAIVGDPIGRDGLLNDLDFEMIAYTPEELIEIGERECAWCLREMEKAAKELGFDDWHAALEHVKDLHVGPGQQTQVVRDLAQEAIQYVRDKDLLTVPPLAAETWRMAMMSPDAQKVNPFFLGGEQIIVSYPTHTMGHREKLMSLRGNNPHFSRATVQHELIPGHHLQFFMLQRHKPYRELFGTPFWIEGWTLYWELLLWDLGFPRGPEDRIGMLFWRMHRCVRIVFSLRFHLGELSPQECIDMLVDRVGHERANAEGEVRRSLKGDYPPLYQAAYMIGGLQVMALRREMVDSGKMTDKQFHDRFMQENQMPIEMLRAVMSGQQADRGFRSSWRFYEL